MGEKHAFCLPSLPAIQTHTEKVLITSAWFLLFSQLRESLRNYHAALLCMMLDSEECLPRLSILAGHCSWNLRAIQVFLFPPLNSFTYFQNHYGDNYLVHKNEPPKIGKEITKASLAHRDEQAAW